MADGRIARAIGVAGTGLADLLDAGWSVSRALTVFEALNGNSGSLIGTRFWQPVDAATQEQNNPKTFHGGPPGQLLRESLEANKDFASCPQARSEAFAPS